MNTTIFRQIATTPMRDIVRGRLTGRLDLPRLIEQVALPQPCADCVLRVVKRTRLWRLEKTDVANELIAHFHDGIDTGASPDELVRDFGNEKTAAKLIRRAKKRCRPLAWHITRGVGWTCTAIVCFYLLLALLLFSGDPTIETDYLAKLNAHVPDVPPDERAWPIYRDALLGLPMDIEQLGELIRFGDRPGKEQWPAIVQLLRDHAPTIDQLRKASARTRLGYTPRYEIAPVDRPLLGDRFEYLDDPSYKNVAYTHAIIASYASPLYYAKSLLAADALLAAEQGDGQRAAEDLRGLYGVAAHRAQLPELFGILSGRAIEMQANRLLGTILHQYSNLLSDAELSEFAHRLSARREARWMRLEGERYGFLDFCQRAYTARGWLTDEGAREFSQWGVDLELGTHYTFVGLLTSPTGLVLFASREEMEDKYLSMLATVEQSLHVPAYQAPRGAIENEMSSWSVVQRVRYAPLTHFVRSLDGIHRAVARRRASFDGTLVAIALTLYEHDHKQWPTTLDALTPRYLPNVPIDQITGDPLCYRVTDSGPIVYSVGVDRDDDGGRAADRTLRPSDLYRPDQWFTDEQYEAGHRNGTLPDGDWVLWPLAQE